ncbi:MAG: serine hydrolase [Bacteroidota bacterium]
MNRFIQQHIYLLILPVIGVVVMGMVWSQDTPKAVYQPSIELTLWSDSDEGDTTNQQAYIVPVIGVSEWEATRVSTALIKNEAEVLPFTDLQAGNYYVVVVGNRMSRFLQGIRQYTSIEVQQVEEFEDIRLRSIPENSQIILALNTEAYDAYDLKHNMHLLAKRGQIRLVNFTPATQLQSLLKLPVILQAPNNGVISQQVCAQILFGGMSASGGLDPEIAASLKIDSTLYSPRIRLAYTDPEYVGFPSDSLARIDAIIEEAIASFAMPGAQVLVAKDGNVIYHKAFGHHTYSRKNEVNTADLYDLASITKIAGTTLASMKMYEQQQLQLRDQLGKYFVDPTYIATGYKEYDTLDLASFVAFRERMIVDSTLAAEFDTMRHSDSTYIVGRWIKEGRTRRRSQVFNIELKDLMTHTSGLQASLPIREYQRNYDQDLFHFASDDQYSVPVAQDLYLRQNWLDTLWNVTKGLSRADTIGYRYSCVNMILMQQVIDSLNQAPISEYLQKEFYGPLGLQSMGYKPLERFEKSEIVPTSKDGWRDQMLCGTVHDPTAALLGGVSGNAGLFSNASDLAVLAQMWLNGGEYGGKRYLADSTIELFTMRHRSHRGYGFDKPPRHRNYYIAPSASLDSYGHTGFTGTCVWVDPEHELVYVFLSNRVHPDEKNFRINELKVRRRVHQVIYDLMDIPMRREQYRPQPKPVELFVSAEQDSTAIVNAP